MNQGPYFYETHLYWTKNRRGLVEVAELPPITTSPPPEFKGEPGFWTPEHLLVAALESCLMTTFLAIAEKSRFKVVSYRSSALAKLETADGSLGFSRVLVRPVIKVSRDEDTGKARRLFEKAERHCLVTKALNIPVHCDVDVVVSEAAEDTPSEAA